MSEAAEQPVDPSQLDREALLALVMDQREKRFLFEKPRRNRVFRPRPSPASFEVPFLSSV
jgi:hypothetical protein